MNVLLDTNVFLWVAWADPRLSRRFVGAFEDEDNEFYLSAVSAWEIAVKNANGRLPLPAPVDDFVTRLREVNDIATLPLDEASTFAVGKLPPLHRDPFDRMLIAQAITHGMVLAASDEIVRRYPVRSLW